MIGTGIWRERIEGMSDTKNLLPCPFCGGKAYFRTDTNGYQKDNRSFSFRIECQNCKMAFPKTFELVVSLNENGNLKFLKDEREEAAGEWNKRFGDWRI